MDRKIVRVLLPALLLIAAITPAFSQETTDTATLIKTLSIGLDTVWVLLAAFLVFFMNLGFAMVESGLCRAKNTVNILAKNFIVFALASVGFWFIGWGLMFSNGTL